MTRRSNSRITKTMGISLPPDDLEFAREQARRYFGENVSRYLKSLIEIDREHELTRVRVLEFAMRDQEGVST